ncbi:hypothetical protein J6590_051332 [Homalodisca vitripennis]|nr:hypothetical protein J6590_051332 [Homalodisca vitripennis]
MTKSSNGPKGRVKGEAFIQVTRRNLDQSQEDRDNHVTIQRKEQGSAAFHTYLVRATYGVEPQLTDMEYIFPSEMQNNRPFMGITASTPLVHCHRPHQCQCNCSGIERRCTWRRLLTGRPLTTQQQSHETLEKSITNRKKNVEGEPVNWLKIRWIKIEKTEPFAVKYKVTFSPDMPFGKINIRKKEHGRPLENLANVPQDLVYNTSRPITMAKKRT